MDRRPIALLVWAALLSLWGGLAVHASTSTDRHAEELALLRTFASQTLRPHAGIIDGLLLRQQLLSPDGVARLAPSDALRRARPPQARRHHAGPDVRAMQRRMARRLLAAARHVGMKWLATGASLLPGRLPTLGASLAPLRLDDRATPQAIPHGGSLMSHWTDAARIAPMLAARAPHRLVARRRNRHDSWRWGWTQWMRGRGPPHQLSGFVNSCSPRHRMRWVMPLTGGFLCPPDRFINNDEKHERYIFLECGHRFPYNRGHMGSILPLPNMVARG